MNHTNRAQVRCTIYEFKGVCVNQNIPTFDNVRLTRKSPHSGRAVVLSVAHVAHSLNDIEQCVLNCIARVGTLRKDWGIQEMSVGGRSVSYRSRWDRTKLPSGD